MEMIGLCYTFQEIFTSKKYNNKMERMVNQFAELDEEVDFFPEQNGKKQPEISKPEIPKGDSDEQYIRLPEYIEMDLNEPKKLKIEQENLLKNFEKSRLAVSKLSASIKKDDLEIIPCPFCAVELTLAQLDHIGQCEEGISCSYCKEKYPSSVFVYHLMVCDKKEQYYAKYQIHKSKQQIKKDNVKVSPKQEKKFFNLRTEPVEKPIAPKRIYSNKNLIKPIQRKIPIEQPQIHRNYELESKIRKQQLKGLKEKEIERIPLEEYYPIRQEDSSCIICTNEVHQGDLIIRLPCLHFFHIDCIRPWLSQRARCPTCKASVRP